MNDAELERLLKDHALKPADRQFTQRVLAALPRWRSGASGVARRSFALASRLGMGFALLVFAQRWYVAGTVPIETSVAIFLFVLAVLAAMQRTSGPLVPRSVRRLLSRVGRPMR